MAASTLAAHSGALARRQDCDGGSGLAHDPRADEDRLERLLADRRAGHAIGEAVNLAAVGVALDRCIEEPSDRWPERAPRAPRSPPCMSRARASRGVVLGERRLQPHRTQDSSR